MKEPRTYTMQARAEAAAATRARILDAAADAMRRQFRPDVRLDAVAAAAGVSVQTVLRVFGSRHQLLDEVAQIAVGDVAAEFAGVPAGDRAGTVHAYVNHYEKVGDLVVRNIQDESDPDIRAFVERGRSAHRAGCEALFASDLEAVPPDLRRSTVDALVVALDVYTWKLLRRDIGRSRTDTETTILSLVTAILEAVR
jgi:AcrR family transcriptional regulator